MKRLALVLVLLISGTSLKHVQVESDLEFADCPNPSEMSVTVDGCLEVAAIVTDLYWSGTGGFNWYIDNNYLGCTPDYIPYWSYDLVENYLNLGSGSHTFSVQGAKPWCDDCPYDRLHKNFTLGSC